MSHKDQLREWFVKEKANGLLDIKFYPGARQDLSIEDIAKDILDVVTGQFESIDITAEQF